MDDAKKDDDDKDDAKKDDDDKDDDDKEFLTRCYSTISICGFCVLFTACLYALFFQGEYLGTHQHYALIEIAVGSALLMIAFVSAYFSAEQVNLKFFEINIPVPFSLRANLLPLFTFALLAAVGGMCYATEGARSSPFAHYLVAISSLSIVFARKPLNRIVILLLTLSVYGLTLFRHLDPGLPLDATGIRVFDFVCVLFAVSFAATAAWRVNGSSRIASKERAA